ncbi:hypothetical protein, partial [Oceanidesulfovibrio marinus]|uniref:hypothetical protein n=1 Tax=Oceanidesulfovibrio marinus TaxID=370038 RepID=UPI001ABFDBDC
LVERGPGRTQLLGKPGRTAGGFRFPVLPLNPLVVHFHVLLDCWRSSIVFFISDVLTQLSLFRYKHC